MAYFYMAHNQSTEIEGQKKQIYNYPNFSYPNFSGSAPKFIYFV